MDREEKYLPLCALTLGGEAEFDNDRQWTGLKKKELAELAESIRIHGLINRIIVWCPPDGPHEGKNIVIAGERRFRAITLLADSGYVDVAANVPVLIYRQPTTQVAELRILALLDNVSRADLNGMEIAYSLKRLADAGLKQAAIAEKCGKSQGWVSLHLSILKKATPAVQAAWQANKITDVDAFNLMRVEPAKQPKKLEKVIELRAAGEKKAASEVAKADDPMRISKPSMAARHAMLDDLKLAVVADVLPYTGREFMLGVMQALEWVEGTRAWTAFEGAQFYAALNPVVEARRKAEIAEREARQKSAREVAQARVADVFEDAATATEIAPAPDAEIPSLEAVPF